MIGTNIGGSIRGSILRTIVIGFMILMAARLLELQLLYHEEYGRQSEANSVRPVPQVPVRGWVYDRNGKLLIDNRPSYSITITPSDFDMRNLPVVARLLDLDTAFVKNRIAFGRLRSRFAPVKITRDVSFQAVATIEELHDNLRGVACEVETKRVYPDSIRGSHLFGYLREISESQLLRYGSYYEPGDITGTTGLEGIYETYLRGEKGYRFLSVNSLGQTVAAYDNGARDIPPREGNDLYLGVDADLQQLSEKLLRGRRGAIIAMDPRNGEVLAFASAPDYDPALLSGVTPAHVWRALNEDPSKPLYNRVTLGTYPPGSTFKMVIATAALQEGVITPDTKIYCAGAFHFGNHIFKDHSAHGWVNVTDAIERSCNVFFYQLALKIGFERLTRYGRLYGFGEPTGIDVGEERSGMLPSEDLFDHLYGKGKWTKGYLVSLGIGQGEIAATPVQMAAYCSALANGGTYVQPHVVRAVKDKVNKKIVTEPYRTQKLPISPEVLAIVREGMRRVVNGPGGTGHAAGISGIMVAGKTGTAQNPHGQDHAWFLAFAPFENPTIAVAIILENAGFGGAQSAPLARALIEQYLKGTSR